jgi:hypothetical protein
MTTTIYNDAQRIPFVDVRTGKLTREAFLFLQGIRSSIPSDTSVDVGALQAGAAEVIWQPTPGADALLETLLQPAAPDALADMLLQPAPYTDMTSWPGSTSVVTLGTVTTGSWQASPLTAGFGGTGLTSYSVGDMLYANGVTSLAKLASAAVGNVLRAGGVGSPPAWGQVALTTDVTGILPVANGGTGVSSLSSLTANPSASIGLTAVNGAASTFMRSDAAPALSQAISPTWSGSHTFGNTITSTVSGATGTALNATGGGTAGVRLAHVGATGTDLYIGVASSTGGNLITGSGAYAAEFRNDGGFCYGIGSTKVVTIDSSGITINVATLLRSSVALTNGAGASTGTLTNAPAAGNPTKWVPISDNGTTRYIPAW